VNEDDQVEEPAPRAGLGGFDPLRSLTDAHRLAIDSADTTFRFFARFLGGDARNGNGNGDASQPATDEHPDGELGFAELRRGVTRSLDLYLDLAERLFDTSTRTLEDALRTRGVTVTGGRRDAVSTPLPIEGRPGERVVAPIWLHNLTDEPLDGARCFASDLVAHTGCRVPARSIVVAPGWSGPVKAGASATAEVAITIPADTPAGIYVGHVLLSPIADASLPLRLHVRDDDSDGDA
jgi:hypothetical protein